MEWKRLEELGLTPNQFYYLDCIFNKKEVKLNILLHYETRMLQHLGYITSDFKLTKKCDDIIDLFTVPEEDVIDRYINLFPNIKLPSNKYARSNRKNIVTSFEWFFKNHEYDWNLILKATKYYIEEYQQKEYKYMRNSQYFIRKQNPDRTSESELANYCEMLKNGAIEEQDNSHFSEKVV